MSFLFNNTKLYIALALMLILNVFLYLKLDNTNAKLEKSQSDLNLALSVNNELTKITQELKTRHEQELKALFHANTQKNQIKTRVDDVKNYISKSNETNTTKLFNVMLDRLWEQNTSINQNTNSKSVNTN
ncbi:hypothetical protein L8U98_07690 [Campylobacter sp. RKI_CA19_01128]|uniref:hypothetical protein n=1 Tax=unclassified Campylobacter TaxID=2593542 RepID=UPI0021E8405A|nr:MULTISPECIES: hypothetical protein [unclassified Campylobacter]MCV3349763.1 hypothetical protein [Campylobacter sp. RKI_CA19_01127]MCV3355727.1 hypothetical protein [Campylobacter sp. RKI_CA19_01128]MCV3396687.1 hypothetical protein [Campylobacter sp. RKI_CA19_01116]HEC1777141.1 hypothetical protein [Campylobacter lari]